MSASQAHDLIVARYASACSSGKSPEEAGLTVMGELLAMYGDAGPPPDVMAAMEGAIGEGIAACGGLSKSPVAFQTSTAPAGRPVGSGAIYSGGAFTASVPSLTSARGPMPTSRTASLTSYRQVAPSSGYRLPSNLTLAARRPTGMTSLRLPPVAVAPDGRVRLDPVEPPPPPADNTALYLGLGVAAVVVGVVVYSSRSSMTANGRRRRSRRRHRRH